MSFRPSRILLVGCIAAPAITACSPTMRDASDLAVLVGTRFGRAETRWDNHPDRVTLSLSLTDRRWTSVPPGMGLRDSALAVARFTLAEIDKTPGLARPDSILVSIQTVNRGLLVFRQSGSSGFSFASNDL